MENPPFIVLVSDGGRAFRNADAMLIIPYALLAPKVFIQYENWIRESNNEPMSLSSVKADLALVLSHLKCAELKYAPKTQRRV